MNINHANTTTGASAMQIRSNWTRGEIEGLFDQPFNDLLFQAQTIHRANFDPNEVQLSTLLSVKTGGCPEDCKYCPQSISYETGVAAEKLMDLDTVVQAAREAREAGASRYCMGAAWRDLKDRDVPKVCAMIREVKALGMETCVTLGMITDDQAGELKSAGLDYYNHNIDTSEEYYAEIITTRPYQERLDTLDHVRSAGINVCCGGIVGMGERRSDRVGMLETLATMKVHPESVPINMLVKVSGTPLDDVSDFDGIEFVRTIAVARVLMPASHVRLSAGRENMNDELQALCFFAGANSIFMGEKLLTTPNPAEDSDRQLLGRLGLRPEPCRQELVENAVEGVA